MSVAARGIRAAVAAAVLSIGMLAGGPAAGDTVEEPQLTDVCGDADALARVNDEKILLPERTAGFDIKQVTLSDIEESGEVVGLRLVLELCGDLPAPELQGSVWSVSWRTPQLDTEDQTDCGTSVRVNDVIDGSEPSMPVRTGYFSASCSESEPYLGGSRTTSVSRFSHTLVASQFAAAGKTVSFELRTADFAGDTALLLEPGAVAVSPSAWAKDGRQLTYFEQSGDSLGTPALYVAPGASDRASGGADFTVGG